MNVEPPLRPHCPAYPALARIAALVIAGLAGACTQQQQTLGVPVSAADPPALPTTGKNK